MNRATGYRRGLLFAGLSFLLLAGGCKEKEPGPDVMARVNGRDILRSEIDKTLKRQLSGSPQKPSPEQEDSLRLDLLRQMIDRQLYLQDAEKQGVAPTNEEVDSRVNQDKAPYTKEEFAKKLQESGFTEEEHKQEVRRNLTVEKLIKREVEAKVTISDADLQTFYNAYKAEFNIPETRFRLAHILVRGANEAQARQKVQMVYQRLGNGEDFASLAQRYSDDTDTANNGGEMGPAPESQIKAVDPATRDAILKLKPGEVSPVLPIQREQFLRAAYDEVLRDRAKIRNYFAEQILKKTSPEKK